MTASQETRCFRVCAPRATGTDGERGDAVEVPEVEGANNPADPFPTPEKLFTIDDDFGGWAAAADKFFADGEDGGPLGIVPQLQQDTGKVGEE